MALLAHHNELSMDKCLPCDLQHRTTTTLKLQLRTHYFHVSLNMHNGYSIVTTSSLTATLPTTDAGNATTPAQFATSQKLSTSEQLAGTLSKQRLCGDKDSGLDVTLKATNIYLVLKMAFSNHALFDDYLPLKCSTNHYCQNSLDFHGTHNHKERSLEHSFLLHK